MAESRVRTVRVLKIVTRDQSRVIATLEMYGHTFTLPPTLIQTEDIVWLHLTVIGR